MASVQSKIQVMVIDDDSDLRTSLGEFLEEVGCAVLFASNGREALEALQNAPILPDVILLDLMMPTMDGWAFREAQLIEPRIASVPVIILTAFVQERPIGLKATAVLYKPFDPMRLVEEIEKATSKQTS